MDVKEFISDFREAFGSEVGLPIVFWYSGRPIIDTPKIEGCFFKAMGDVRAGRPMSLSAAAIGCGGGKFYTGFAPMGAHVPNFVSLKERYKDTPEMVLDHIARSEVPTAAGEYLNFARIDTLGEAGGIEDFDGIEGIVFFATPDVLAGLATWAWFDNNDEDAVTTRFGSGCSTIVSDAVRENRRGGRRVFIGCFDVSVRPHLAPDELSFTIPHSRLLEMLGTMRRSSLFDTHAWPKVRDRIQSEQ